MRNRLLTTESHCGPNYLEILEQIYVNGTFPPYRLDQMSDTSSVTYTHKVSDISDESMVSLPEVYVDPITGRWRRYKRHRAPPIEVGATGEGGLMRSQLKPVHRCVHYKDEIKVLKDLTVVAQSHDFAGNSVHDRFTTRTYNNLDGIQVLHRFGVGSPDYIIQNSQVRYTAGDYLGHDWFALTASFDEACSQFIHSSTLIGESIIQNSIFVDAFKLVLNPTNAIRSFIKLGSRFKRNRKMNLGQMSKKLMKGSANANLFYQFGVKPAIDDIKDVFLAHKRVSERLRLLRSNAGRYVPIRVKDEIFSSHSNELLEADDTLQFEWTMRHKRSIAHIGGWGRVRSDLQFTDTWSAYLQYFGINKIAGLAWELIPFSFVVDWFTNAQERINYYTRDRTGGPFEELCNIWSSVKQESLTELNLLPGRVPSLANTFIVDPSSPRAILERVVSQYTRNPFIPETSGVLDFSALGLFHAITSGSLILQQWR